MPITLAPIDKTSTHRETPVSNRAVAPRSKLTAAGDTVQLSTAAQLAVLTPAEAFLRETDTHAQIVKAAANGDPQAKTLLAVEAALNFVQ